MPCKTAGHLYSVRHVILGPGGIRLQHALPHFGNIPVRLDCVVRWQNCQSSLLRGIPQQQRYRLQQNCDLVSCRPILGVANTRNSTAPPYTQHDPMPACGAYPRLRRYFSIGKQRRLDSIRTLHAPTGLYQCPRALPLREKGHSLKYFFYGRKIFCHA